MNENFNKFKKRLLLEHTLRTALFALAIGLTTAGLVVGITALCSAMIHWAIYLGIGLAAFVLSFVLLFVFTKPDDKKVAARVDEDLELQEKVATMVEYKDQNGLLIDRQRDDADYRLEEKSAKAVPLKVAAFSIPALIFGASVFTASMFTPMIKHAVDDKIDDIDNTNKKTDEIIKDIADLIDKSGAAKDLQEDLLKILDNLQSQLEGDDSIDSRQAKVDAAKILVDEAVAKANTSDEIGPALKKEVLGDLTEDRYDELGDLEQILFRLAKAITEVDTSETSGTLAELRDYVISRMKDGDNHDLGVLECYDGYAGIVNRTVDFVKKALDASGVKNDNAMYIALNTFQKNLSMVSADMKIRYDEVKRGVDEDRWSDKGIGATEAQAKTKEVFNTCIKELTDAINLEATNTQLGEEVKKLMDQLVDPSKQEGEGDGEGDGDGDGDGDENGDNDSDGDGDKNDGENGDKGETGDGDGNQDGNDEGNNDSGSGDQSGNGSSGKDDSSSDSDSSGDGATNGSGQTNYAGNDKVFQDGETKKYGDVIGESQGDAKNDAGDGDLSDAVSDYFDSLYGNSDNSGTKNP